jgi:hypothetical protein
MSEWYKEYGALEAWFSNFYVELGGEPIRREALQGADPRPA